MCCAAVLPGCARSPRPQRLDGKLSLGVPPHSTAQAAACRLWRSREGAGRRREPGAMEQRCGRRLRCSSVGNVWWWGVAMAVGSAPERCDGGERVPRQLGKLPSVTSVFLYFLLDPEATPRLALPPLSLSTPCGGARRCAPAPSGRGAMRFSWRMLGATARSSLNSAVVERSNQQRAGRSTIHAPHDPMAP